MDVNDAVRELLAASGKSQDALSKDVGVSLRSITHYVAGTREPTTKVLISLAQVAANWNRPDLEEVFHRALVKHLGINSLALYGGRREPGEPLKYALALKPKNQEQQYLCDALLLVMQNDSDEFTADREAVRKVLKTAMRARESLEYVALAEQKRAVQLLGEGLDWEEVAKQTALNPGTVLFLKLLGLQQPAQAALPLRKTG
jgi:transcriptional regulator with XRE-family HTH domain